MGQRPVTAQDREWLATARRLAHRSLAPPARCAGALARTASGGHAGVAIELDTVPGLSVCAEQVALSAARAAGEADIRALYLWLPAAAGAHPCGRCLQVWRELAPQAPLWRQRGDGQPECLILAELLPDPFGLDPAGREHPPSNAAS